MTDAPPPTPATVDPDSEARTFALLAHLGIIITWFIAPLIFWLIGREKSAFLDRHGKEALNFAIFITIVDSVAFFLLFIGSLLMVILIGFVIAPVGLLILLASLVITLIFCIQAAIKANAGQEYRYPVTIRFIK